MPLACMEFDIEDKAMKGFVAKTKDNLEGHNMLTNPFVGGIDIKENIIILDMTPMYPNVSWYAVLSCLIIPIFTGFTFSWWLILPVFFALTSIPFSTWFIYQMFKKGARKAGYKGSLKRIDNRDVIRRFLICPKKI